MDHSTDPGIDKIRELYPGMIQVPRDQKQVVNFEQLRHLLNQSYKMAQVDKFNPSQVYDAVKNPSNPRHVDYETVYKKLKQFVSSSPMIDKMR